MSDEMMDGREQLDEWREVRLGEVCVFTMGQSPPSETYNTDGIGMPFLQGKAEFTSIYPQAEKYCSQPLKIGKKGSTLISVRAPVGDANLADRDYIIGRGLAAIRLDKGDDLFLFYLLLHHKERIAALGSGTTFQSINKTTLDNFSVQLPPLPQQRAIAHALRTVQAARETRRREAALERERKAALMQVLFTRGTRGEPTKTTEIGEVPVSWDVVELATVAHFESGGTPSKEREDWWQGRVPWVSPKDLKKPRLTDVADHITDEALAEGSRLAPKGTVFIVVRGMILAKDVPVAIADVPMAFNQDLKAIIPGNRLVPDFLLYTLMQRKEDIGRLIGTSAHGTKRIGTSALEEFLVPIPPQTEQRTIAEVLRACDEKIAALEREAAAHDELFKALLEELMTGRKRATALVAE